jgi:hypothetical protein
MISRTTLDAAAKVAEHTSRQMLARVGSEAWPPAPDAARAPLHGAPTADSSSEDPDNPASNRDSMPQPQQPHSQPSA